MAQQAKDDGGVSKALADSKKLLDKTNNGKPVAMPAKTAPAAAAAAPAAPKKKGLLDTLKNFASEASKEGADVAAGLKNRQANEKAATDSLKEDQMPKMHDGGKVKKDGPHNLQKGEVVVSKDKASKNKSLVDALGAGKSDEKEPEKKSEKEPEKAKKKLKGMHIRHAASGGYIAKHDMEADPNQPMQESPEHIIPDMNGLQAHMQEHMSQPAQGGEQPMPEPMGEEKGAGQAK